MNYFAIIFILLISSSIAAPSKRSKLFKGKTMIENPFNLRDPFKPPTVKGDSRSSGQRMKNSQGEYSNITDVDLEAVTIPSIKLMGVLIGKERRAMVKAGDGKGIIILKEGMRIGSEGAELKAILPGGIVIVEKIINVYGEEEYLETVIPISR